MPSGKGQIQRVSVPIANYLLSLKDLGYSFRLNEAGDVLEVNGHRLDDNDLAKIRAEMREEGFTNVAAVEDVLRREAFMHRYHPIKTYLTCAGLSYDGGQHISHLAGYFEDTTLPFPLFGTWLRKWLIGAVAKAMNGSHSQNAMLVLDGPQGIGKSYFARWLCAPMADYFLDDAINTSDKDSVVRLATYWIWEVGELGATMRRADVEALKAFISRQVVSVRKPYARIDMVKPALASLIGTVNNSAGILADQTGNRRFLVATINSIDWDYVQAVDQTQMWGEAFTAYSQGETWYLSGGERAQSEENNAAYRVPNPIEGYLTKYFVIDAHNTTEWSSTGDIVARLFDMGYKGQSTRSVAMEVAATLSEMGLVKLRKRVGGNPVWGYSGIWAGMNVP